MYCGNYRSRFVGLIQVKLDTVKGHKLLPVLGMFLQFPQSECPQIGWRSSACMYQWYGRVDCRWRDFMCDLTPFGASHGSDETSRVIQEHSLPEIHS